MEEQNRKNTGNNDAEYEKTEQAISGRSADEKVVSDGGRDFSENGSVRTPAVEESGKKGEKNRKSTGIAGKIALILIAALIAGGAYGYHYWNLPEQRAARALKSADELMQGGDYEAAVSGYAEVLAIDGENDAAMEGRVEAMMILADEAAETAKDIPSRALVCSRYEEIIAFCEECLQKVGNDPVQKEETAAEAETARMGSETAAEAETAREGIETAAEAGTARMGSETAAEAETAREGIETAAGTGTGRQGFESTAEYLKNAEAAAADKLKKLREEIAVSYQSVKCVTEKDDRSGKVILADGREIPYSWYYDLVRIDDEYYPLSEQINGELSASRDAFFAGDMTNPSAGIPGDSVIIDGSYLDYVGVTDMYSGDGILSIRMAEIRVSGNAKAGFFRGITYRLADGRRLTLEDVTDRTDSGLRQMLSRRLRDWFDTEGYTSITRKDVEEYVENTDIGDFKYFVGEGGKVFLVVDQDVPFFNGAGEMLEIPLD